jgi:hypothetical protein
MRELGKRPRKAAEGLIDGSKRFGPVGRILARAESSFRR